MLMITQTIKPPTDMPTSVTITPAHGTADHPTLLCAAFGATEDAAGAADVEDAISDVELTEDPDDDEDGLAVGEENATEVLLGACAQNCWTSASAPTSSVVHCSATQFGYSVLNPLL